MNFPYNNSPKNKKERDKLDAKWENIKMNFQEKVLKEVQKIKLHEIKPLQNGKIYPISQKHSKFSKINYGKLDTIGDSGCGPLAVEYALRLLNIHINFGKIVEECVSKGYRAYIYDDLGKIIDGCGTEYELFDNLANRLNSILEIIQYLQNRNPVTLLVENSKYHEDEKKNGNHFVTIIGIDQKNNAIIMDGNLITQVSNKSMAVKYIQFKKLITGIKLAWGWNKEKVESYLK